MSEVEKTKKLCIITIILAFLIVVLETMFLYGTLKTTVEVVRENESLKGKIEYQKSVIMDLEEYLRGNLE
jgi:hypothetical protein